MQILDRNPDKPSLIPIRDPFDIKGDSHIFSPVENPTYLIDGLIREGSLTLLCAFGGSGKTWIATSMMVSVAFGKTWLGKYTTKQENSLFIDWESGDYELRRRIQKCAAPFIGLPRKNMGISIMPRAYLSAPDFEETAIRLVSDYKLIIIDSLRASAPDIDENSSMMRLPLDTLRRIGDRTGCAFVVIHHSPKPSATDRTNDLRFKVRGSSAIYDAADNILSVSLQKDGKMRLDQSKARQGQQMAPLVISMKDTEDGVGIELISETSLPEVEEDHLEILERWLTKIIERFPGENHAALVARTQKPAKSVQIALNNLEATGLIYKGVQDGKTIYFRM